MEFISSHVLPVNIPSFLPVNFNLFLNLLTFFILFSTTITVMGYFLTCSVPEYKIQSKHRCMYFYLYSLPRCLGMKRQLCHRYSVCIRGCTHTITIFSFRDDETTFCHLYCFQDSAYSTGRYETLQDQHWSNHYFHGLSTQQVLTMYLLLESL